MYSPCGKPDEHSASFSVRGANFVFLIQGQISHLSTRVHSKGGVASGGNHSFRLGGFVSPENFFVKLHKITLRALWLIVNDVVNSEDIVSGYDQ